MHNEGEIRKIDKSLFSINILPLTFKLSREFLRFTFKSSTSEQNSTDKCQLLKQLEVRKLHESNKG